MVGYLIVQCSLYFDHVWFFCDGLNMLDREASLTRVEKTVLSLKNNWILNTPLELYVFNWATPLGKSHYLLKSSAELRWASFVYPMHNCCFIFFNCFDNNLPQVSLLHSAITEVRNAKSLM